MNDRFKFRGFHPVLAEVQEIKFIDFIHNTVDFGDCDIFNIEDVEIQQCTGLKDKNGKLIYEGDIVKRYFICRSSIGDIVEENLFTVEFEDFKFGLCQIAILEGGTDYSPFLNFDEALELEEYAEKMEKITLEVIGNKFENLELLEE